MKRILRSLTWTLVEGSIKGTRLDFLRDQIDLHSQPGFDFSLCSRREGEFDGEKERKNLKVRILGKCSPNFILV